MGPRRKGPITRKLESSKKGRHLKGQAKNNYVFGGLTNAYKRAHKGRTYRGTKRRRR